MRHKCFIFILPALMIMIVTACKKESEPDPLNKGCHDHKGMSASVAISEIYDEADVITFRNGVTGVFQEDNLKLFSPELKEIKNFDLSSDRIMALNDNSFVTISSTSVVVESSSSGLEGYHYVGRSVDCKKHYSFAQAEPNQKLEQKTQISRYDLSGNKIFDISLKGILLQNGIVEQDGRIKFFLLNRDSVAYYPVMENGVYQDTIEIVKDDTDLLVYEYEYSGARIGSKNLQGLQSEISIIHGHLSSASEFYWIVTDYEILKISSDLEVLDRRSHFKSNCFEYITDVWDINDDILIRSVVQNQEEIYRVKPAMNQALDIDLPVDGTIFATVGNRVFIYDNPGYFYAYDLQSTSNKLHARTIGWHIYSNTTTLSCDESVFTLAASGVMDQLIRADPK